jgi:hypothetical protein
MTFLQENGHAKLSPVPKCMPIEQLNKSKPQSKNGVASVSQDITSLI